MRFDLESLKAFVAVVEEGSIAAASERLHLVPSAVSKRISDLECDAGTSLLYRHSRGVRATPAGDALYHHSRRLLEHLRQIAGELSEYAEGVRGHARLHVNFSAMAQYLPADLSAFVQANPEIRIDLVESTSDQIVHAVETGMTDIGICAATSRTTGLDVRAYRVDRLVLIVPRQHPLASREKVGFEETLEYDFVGLQLGTSLHQLCSEAAIQVGKRLKLRIQVTSFEALRNMVSVGLGIGVLPEASVSPYLQISSLKMLELDEPWAIRPLQIVLRSYEALSVPSRLLVDHLEKSTNL
ncbi:HTH-type transcriptional regulator CysL [compost metagenome]